MGVTIKSPNVLLLQKWTLSSQVLGRSRRIFYKRFLLPWSGGGKAFMKIKISFAGLLTLTLFTAVYSQTLDRAKLDQFFDRLAEKK